MKVRSQNQWNFLRDRLAEGNARAQDVEKFDWVVSRRHFLGTMTNCSALAAAGVFGAGIEAVATALFGRGLIPAAWAAEDDILRDKPGMLIHSKEPLTGEFSPDLLADSVTPVARHFVRNNGLLPERALKKDLHGWKLTIDGEVQRALALTMEDLEKYPAVTLQLIVECAGNGRAYFEPKVSGSQWQRGAVGCSQWTGIRLRDVLKQAGLKDTAFYTAHFGEDLPIGKHQSFSRGIPIEKAMEEHTILAYKMNGGPLPSWHGFPVRLIVPGWIASCSQKWLNRIWIRNQVHDSEKMSGYSYRIPKNPVAPGQKPSESEMIIATACSVKSLITAPAQNSKVSTGQLHVAGHAWAGENAVVRVEVSTDFGINWKAARLNQPANKYAWYDWETELELQTPGYYEVWARAFDDQGNSQPFAQPWNPEGYLGNIVHRVAIAVQSP